VIKIFHAIKPIFMHRISLPHGPAKPVFPNEFKKVAEIETDDLEDAYRRSQNIDEPWTWYPGVKVFGLDDFEQKCRSTSVGDVLEHNGKFFHVSEVGFEEFVPGKV
jgi:hypothetical protein